MLAVVRLVQTLHGDMLPARRCVHELLVAEVDADVRDFVAIAKKQQVPRARLFKVDRR